MILQLTPAKAIKLAHALLEKARMVNEKAADAPGRRAAHFVTTGLDLEHCGLEHYLRIRVSRKKL